MYYFNARWYDPKLGRFTTEDPIRAGLNWYIYANNNPLRFVDPTGLAEIDGAGSKGGPKKDAGSTRTTNTVNTSSGSDVDVTDTSNKYTIDDSSYYGTDFTIDYFLNDSEAPITVSYGDNNYIVGEDLDFGDSVPYDAIFNVPEGSSLEITNGNIGFSLTDSGEVNLPETIAKFNATEVEKNKSNINVEGALIGTAGIIGGVNGIVASLTGIGAGSIMALAGDDTTSAALVYSSYRAFTGSIAVTAFGITTLVGSLQGKKPDIPIFVEGLLE